MREEVLMIILFVITIVMIGAANSIQNKNSQNSAHLLNLEMEQKDIIHGHKRRPSQTIRQQ